MKNIRDEICVLSRDSDISLTYIRKEMFTMDGYLNQLTPIQSQIHSSVRKLEGTLSAAKSEQEEAQKKLEWLRILGPLGVAFLPDAVRILMLCKVRVISLDKTIKIDV